MVETIGMVMNINITKRDENDKEKKGRGGGRKDGWMEGRKEKRRKQTSQVDRHDVLWKGE